MKRPKEIPTVSYDVIVAGAGVAGVAAALAAAEEGAKVALIEKTIFPGGLATTGLVFFYLQLCDGKGTQVSYGLVEKLLKASIKYGPDSLKKKDWGKTPWK
ncbi:MAG: FAD-dependent oxidoreductase, partial [Lentisphaeria bacterium]|nr:FAD-dependent oxidoreductase [Lentisphaeria bacterium]